MTQSMTRDVDEKMFQRRGSVAACTVLMLANALAPAVALADGGDLCHVKADYNCDQVVDGQDLGTLLSSWGNRAPAIDLSGDCEVGGPDLTMILASWGATPEVPELAPIQMEDELVTLCLGDSEIGGMISADLQVNPDRAVFDGWATASMGTDVFGTMTFFNGSVLVTVGGTKLVIDGDNSAEELLVNNMPVEYNVFIHAFESDIALHGLDVDQWNEASQAIIMLSLLHATGPYSQAINSQRVSPIAAGFWCKVSILAAAAIIIVWGTTNCVALTAGCVAGTFVSIGGLLIPCVFLIGLCAGGVFFAVGVTTEALQQFWIP